MDIETNIEEKKDRGFTLVELLIVIVILGILATVTVFAVRGITDKGQESACDTEQKTLETAVEAWYALPATVDHDGDPATAAVAKDADTSGDPDVDELIAVGLIRDNDASEYTIGADGAVGPTAGGACV